MLDFLSPELRVIHTQTHTRIHTHIHTHTHTHTHTHSKIRPVNCKGINTEYSPEGLMLNLKLQYLGHLM